MSSKTSAKGSLETFIREKSESLGKCKSIDWDKKKDLWIQSVNALYETIETWLQPSINEGSLRILSRHALEISEEYLGNYSVDGLTILIGKQKVSFYPKGMLIVGAEGRIDIRGQKTTKSIVLIRGKWKVVQKTPDLKFVEFNKATFRNVLAEVMV